ncbi:MAG: hypothetical protein P1V35_04990, partial [Planctomycetota bacterium]|nr:hypothetical protein [Planctomycetota bacterium]
MHDTITPVAFGRGARGLMTSRFMAVAIAMVCFAGLGHAQQHKASHVTLGPSVRNAPPGAVARFTHNAPTRTTYKLHGTLPIPHGTWDGDRDHPTLAVVSYDGTLAHT